MAGVRLRMLLILVIVWGGGLIGGVHSATMEQIESLVKGPLWNQTKIDIWGENLSGPIPPELGRLTNLTSLALYKNSLSGPIPPELGSLTSLTYLNLSFNSLSGPIPPELSKLTKLNTLYLYSNILSGTIPPELGRLTNLSFLALYDNNLSGSIPPELGRLTNLSLLALYENNLSGPIPPELGSLFKLDTLYLYSNNLSGPIPPEFGSLTNLSMLILRENHLSGPIPPDLSNLARLSSLDLSRNFLKGPIPPEFGILTKLHVLDLSINSLSGPIPPDLGSLSELTDLILRNNSLSGPIPPEFRSLTRLSLLYLSNNNLSAGLPLELWNLVELKFLVLGNNSLTGTIHPGLGRLTSLITLDLSSNSFFGPIPPELGSLSKLTFLYLSANNLSSGIPPELWDLTELSSLKLSNNRLSGHIPPELEGLTSLYELYLSYNSFTGPIPPELGSLTYLQHLDLSNNKFSGPIPPELGKLTYLRGQLDLSYNSFTGSIPPTLGKLVNLDELHLSNNILAGPIPPELGQLTTLYTLRLDNNNLFGFIPRELATKGLFYIETLRLENNNLSGRIPPELGSLAFLSTLRLDNNNLSGDIPPQLGDLTHLVDLNLTSTKTSCKTIDLSELHKLASLGLPCSPPSSFKETNITYVTLSVGSPSTKELDLSSVPNSCKIVNLTGSHPHLESIRFWSGCETGCIVNLAGTGRARLSRNTRREVCLHKISIFLGGDIPYPVYSEVLSIGFFVNVSVLEFSNTLKNQQGKVFNLTDPDFVNSIDLGPEGRAYTGVGFTRVQAGNLCGNPEAKQVTAVIFGAFAVALLVATILVVVIARWRRRIRGSGRLSEDEGCCHIPGLKSGGLYLWGAARGILPVVDLVTDFLVLSDVWGAWPMWVLLASVCVPFALGAYVLAKSWASTRATVRGWKDLRVRWLWPLPELGEELLGSRGTGARYSWLLAIVLLPLGLVGILVQDLLSVSERFGVHLAWGDEIVVFERYHESRVMVELLLESLPQAIFQTGLYIIGSSRATRIYIDQRIFVQSIVVSLCSLSMHYLTMLWEAVYEGKSLVRIFLDRFKSAGRPILVRVTATPREDAEEMGEMSSNIIS